MHGGVSGGGGGGAYKKDPLEELVSAGPSQQNWKSIGIALLVIGGVIGLIALSVYTLKEDDLGKRIKGDRIRLNDIVDSSFRPRTFNGTWISGSKLIFASPGGGGVSILDVASGETKNLMSNSTFRQLNSQTFFTSPDLEYVIIPFNKNSVFRHSYTAQYALYSVKSSSHVVLTLSPSEVDPAKQKDRFQLAMWVPNGGHALVVVYKNDIHYIADVERPESFVRVTSSGKNGVFFNGIPDWLYEEEILTSNSAIWFSSTVSSNSKMVYGTFDDTEVGQVNYNEYGGSEFPEGKRDLRDPPPYPELRSLRYPKVGTENPKASLSVVTLSDISSKKTLTPPESIRAQGDFYFSSVVWVTSRVVAVTWLNRAQNISVVSKCSEPEYNCEEIHLERTFDRKGWIDISKGPPTFSADGSQMLLIHPMRHSPATGYFPQLAQKKADVTTVAGEKEPTALTHGTFYVTKIVAWDEVRHLVYFIGTLSGFPGVRHLLRVGDLLASEETKPMLCITCEGEGYVTTHDDEVKSNDDSGTSGQPECQFNDVAMSPSMEYIVQICHGPNVPYTRILALNQNNSRSTVQGLRMLDANSDLRDLIEVTAMPKVKHLVLPLPGTRTAARIMLLLPPGMVEAVDGEEEEFRFPLVVNVYGGPGSQNVDSRFGVEWSHYLASALDFVVAHMDVRGTGFSGEEFMHAVHHQLGAIEAGDSMRVVRHLIDNVPYVDPSRVAVWGWSYGGTVASRMLALDVDNSLKCAIAVAPVTKWELYDSAYTERFMGLPSYNDNWKGYRESDITEMAERFVGKSLFLIHATADKNVHFQQSMVLAKRLVAANVTFRQQIYADGFHDLLRGPNSAHPLTSMEKFLSSSKGCLGPLPNFFTEECLEDGDCFRDRS